MTSASANDYEIGFRIRGDAERVDIVVTDVWDDDEFDRWTAPPDVFVTYSTGGSLGCNWVAHTNGVGAGYQGPVAIMPPNRLYRLDFIGYAEYNDPTPVDTVSFSYYLCQAYGPGGTFYCPYTTVSIPDYFFRHYGGGPGEGATSIRVRPVHIWPDSVDEYYGFDEWVLPYNPLPAGPPGDYPFLTPDTGNTYRLADTDVTLEDLWAESWGRWKWTPPEPIELLFKPGRRLHVDARLDAGGVTLGASVPAQGWGGLDLQSGGDLDVLGRRVAVLASGRYEAGSHALSLDGSSLPAGIYVVHVVARGASGSSAAVRRITLAR